MEVKVNKNRSNIIIIILLILVIGMAIYIIYDKYFIRSKVENKSKENLTETQEDLTESNNNSNTLTNTMNDQEAIDLGNRLWTYAYDSFWGRESVWKRHVGPVDQYGVGPIICDTTAEEVKVKYTTDFKAEFCFEANCNYYDIDFFISGNCEGAGRGGDQTYIETILKVNEIKANEIKFTATSTYCDSAFCHNGKNVSKTIDKDFIIKKVDNNWLISYFHVPN